MASSSQHNLSLILFRPPEPGVPIPPSPEEMRVLRIEVANLGFAYDNVHEELLRVRIERDRLRNRLRLIYTVMTAMFAEREPPNVREAWQILRAYAQMIRGYLSAR